MLQFLENNEHNNLRKKEDAEHDALIWLWDAEHDTRGNKEDEVPLPTQLPTQLQF